MPVSTAEILALIVQDGQSYDQSQISCIRSLLADYPNNLKGMLEFITKSIKENFAANDSNVQISLQTCAELWGLKQLSEPLEQAILNEYFNVLIPQTLASVTYAVESINKGTADAVTANEINRRNIKFVAKAELQILENILNNTDITALRNTALPKQQPMESTGHKRNLSVV